MVLVRKRAEQIVRQANGNFKRLKELLKEEDFDLIDLTDYSRPDQLPCLVVINSDDTVTKIEKVKKGYQVSVEKRERANGEERNRKVQNRDGELEWEAKTVERWIEPGRSDEDLPRERLDV